MNILMAILIAVVTKDDLLTLAKAGCSDDVVRTFIRTKGPVVQLSCDDLVELKAAGLSDAMLLVAVTPVAPPKPKNETVVEKPRPVYYGFLMQSEPQIGFNAGANPYHEGYGEAQTSGSGGSPPWVAEGMAMNAEIDQYMAQQTSNFMQTAGSLLAGGGGLLGGGALLGGAKALSGLGGLGGALRGVNQIRNIPWLKGIGKWIVQKTPHTLGLRNNISRLFRGMPLK